MNSIAVTGWSSAKFVASGFCVCGMSKKPTPLIETTAPSCFQLFVAWPQLEVNFLRAAMMALRSRVLERRCKDCVDGRVRVPRSGDLFRSTPVFGCYKG